MRELWRVAPEFLEAAQDDATIVAIRVIVAPDCGMKYLPREVAFGKLRAMTAAARLVRQELATPTGVGM